MSTIQEVRAAEEKVNHILDELRKADAQDPNRLSAELNCATDEYARAVRELEWT
jgi:cytidylate kinase